MTLTTSSSTRLFGFGEPGHGAVELDRHQTRWVVVDVETTGLSPTADRIVELAIVTIDSAGTVIDEYATLLDPGRDVGPTWVHRITNDAVAGAPEFADVAGELFARLDGAVVVAHNASFDEKFLEAELRRCGQPHPQVPAVCTLALARRAALPTANYRLATCCAHYGISCVDAHSALGDTRSTASMLPLLLDDVEARRGPLRFPVAPTSMPRVPVTAAPQPRS